MIDTKTKALKVIEMLTLMQAHSINKTNEKSVDEFLSDIYRFSHIAIDECENEHGDWRDELNNMYDSLKDDGHLD